MPGVSSISSRPASLVQPPEGGSAPYRGEHPPATFSRFLFGDTVETARTFLHGGHVYSCYDSQFTVATWPPRCLALCKHFEMQSCLPGHDFDEQRSQVRAVIAEKTT